MHVQLAEQNGSCVTKPLHDGGIFAWDAILEERATCGCSYASGIDQVLQSDGNAVKRTSGRAALQLPFRLTSLFQRRFRGDGDERIEYRIQRFNPRQTGAGQFNRGYLFLSQQCRGFLQIEAGEIVRRAQAGHLRRRDGERARAIGTCQGCTDTCNGLFEEESARRFRQRHLSRTATASNSREACCMVRLERITGPGIDKAGASLREQATSVARTGHPGHHLAAIPSSARRDR